MRKEIKFFFFLIIFLFLYNFIFDYCDFLLYLEVSEEKPNLIKNIPDFLRRINWKNQCFIEIYKDNKNFEFKNSANLIFKFYVYPTQPGFKVEMFEFLLKDEYIHKAARETNILIEIYLVLNEERGNREFWMNSYFLEKTDIWAPLTFFYHHWGNMPEEVAIAGAKCIRLEVYRVPDKFDMYFYVSRFMKPLPRKD